MPETLASRFVATLRDDPARTFSRWCRGDQRIAWSYADAAARVHALHDQFAALGIRSGDNVVIHTADMMPSILFDLACACAGVVFTPLETSSLPAVVDLCSRVDAKAVLTTPDRAALHSGRPVIALDGTEPIAGDPGTVLARLAERAAGIDPRSPYMLQPTSGTTGGPKLVIRDHACFVRVGKIFRFGHTPADPQARVLMVPALTHGMGQYLFVAGIEMGAEYGITTKIDVAADIDEIRWLDPTHMALTPRVMRSIVHQLGGLSNVTRIFGPSAKVLVSSGAPPDKDILAAVHRSGVMVIEGYGASEPSIIAMTRLGQWNADLVGHVLDDVDVRVGDDGELLAKTPGMFRGYYGAPELTKQAFTDDGYYKTGDRVSITNGEFRYLGRVVDSFNLFDGSHVAPGPIEEAIARLPWVDQVLLLGDQRPYLVGLVVPHPALRKELHLLRAIAKRDLGTLCGALEPNARIRRVAILDEPLAPEVYQIVGHGKIRRLRSVALAHYADLVTSLYAQSDAHVDIPGTTNERRGASRCPLRWLVRLRASDNQLAYTRDVGRGGAFVEDVSLASGSAIAVDVIEADGHSFVLDAEVTRSEPGGVALRWLGPPASLEELARRVSA